MWHDASQQFTLDEHDYLLLLASRQNLELNTIFSGRCISLYLQSRISEHPPPLVRVPHATAY